MKKLAVTLCLSAIAVGAFAQGTVNFVNTSATLFRLNSTATGGGIVNTPPTAQGFYFGLFTASSTITSATINDILTPTWTFTGLYGTNTAATAGGRMSGGNGAATLTGWQPGVTNSFVVVGWSANLGHDWTLIRDQAASGGVNFSGGAYYGTGWATTVNAFLGLTAVGFAQAGGGPTGIPAPNLFGPISTQANPVQGLTDLYPVLNIPEPSTFALAGLGAAALVIFRRRKQ